MKPFLAALTCLLCALPAAGQALNFENPVALGNINTDALPEGSGIAASFLNPGVFWTHNDGSRNRAYAFRMDGALLADFDFGRATQDVEDIAIGPGPEPAREYLYLADIGSNSATRDTVTVFRIPEPTVDQAWVDDPLFGFVEDSVAFYLRYPDGTFDAEALFIDPIDKKLYVATKQTGTCRLYSIALSAMVAEESRDLEFIAAINFDRVNAGDISRDGSLITLRRGGRANLWVRNPGESFAQAMARDGVRLPLATEPNGEAIAFLPDNSGYITLSEGDFQPVYLARRIQPCNEAPTFTAPPEFADGSVTLTFTGCAGSTVIVERSSNLQTWTDRGPVSVNTAPSTFTDQPPFAPAFYRLRVVQ